MADLELTGSVHESAGQEQEKARTPEQERDKTDLEEIIEHYTMVVSIEDAQRKQEDEDLEFEGGDQWLQTHRDSRAEHTDDVTGRKVAARPTLSINLVEGRVLQIVNEARQARLGLTVTPKAGLANTTAAGYYKGLIRSIQTDSGASEVRIWALERAAICGRGAYRFELEFANDGDFDLDIVIKRILDQGSVYWDPYSVIADRRDADWCFASAQLMSEKERLRRWPNKPILPTEGAFENTNHAWFPIDTKHNKSVLVVTYYKVIYEEQILVYSPLVGNIGPMKKAELPAEIRAALDAKDPSLRSRKVDVRRVVQIIADGSQILERDPWPGRYIPVIPVTGKEKNIKGKRSWKGVVTNLKDLNRGYNVTISSAVEAAGKIPRSEYIMYAGQDEGFEEMWDDSPIKAYTRLYINPMMLGDKPAPFPQRTNQEPAIQGTLLLARVLKDDIGSVGGTVDPAMRAVNPYDRSGKAIEALQRQGAAGTSNFLDNLATISMMQEGRVLIDLIPKVLDRKGRIIGVMGEENDEETAIMLKVPFIHDADGNPIPVPCPVCRGQGQVRPPRSLMNPLPAMGVCPACKGDKLASEETMPKEYQGQPVKYVDLSRGEFKVSPAIGRNYQTKQEEAMAAMTELATSAPALVPIYADLWVRAMGFSGSNEIADRIKRSNPNAQDEKDQAGVPPEFAAKFQQLQMQHQAAMDYIQKLTKALEADQVKTAGQKEMLAMKLEAAEGLEHLKQQHELMQQTVKGQASAEVDTLKAHLAAMAQESQHRHEVLLELLQQKNALAIEEARAAAAKAAREDAMSTPEAAQ